MKKLSVFLIIMLIFTPFISNADYFIDSTNGIVVDGFIENTVLTAHEVRVDYIYEEDIIKALDEIDFEFNGNFIVHIIDYSTYNQDILGLALPSNDIVLFDFIPYRLSYIVQNTMIHELGHLVYMQMDEVNQEVYKLLRGIPREWDNYPRTTYQNRPQEIFAEDFRVLLGGHDASLLGHDNQLLEHPSNIIGLEGFIRRFEKIAITK